MNVEPQVLTDEVRVQPGRSALDERIDQGYALAFRETHKIIQTIQRRVAAHQLDRGLKISLPYFNDQTLHMELYEFEVIPNGRIMFVPAFVVLAARAQQTKVARDTRLSSSTRDNLLADLSTIAAAFESSDAKLPIES